MRTSLALSVCLLFLACGGGCATLDFFRGDDDEGPPPMTAELANVRQALVDGRTQMAERCLDQIMPHVQGPSRTTARLLLAETRVQQERPDDALALAQEVLSNTPDDLAAHEVAGKALLKLGEFDLADQHLAASAAAGDVSDADRRRREDLLALARGLSAWSRAEPDVARRYWAEIDHPKLRSAVDEIVNDRTRTLARTP